MGDAQDEQIPTGRLQQGLQPRFKTAPEDEQRGRGTAGGHFLIWEASPLKLSCTHSPTHPPLQASPGAAGIFLLAFLLSPLSGLQVL